jgi:hypothetical protein
MSEEESCIRGAFVICQKIKNKRLTNSVLIKLTSINSIEAVNGNEYEKNECIFYTYKDCAYHAEIHPYDLTKAINGVIFDEYNHIQNYPD